MKTKWILILGIFGALLAGFGIVYSKNLSQFGRADIDKTLSSIDKLKKMQEEQAFDADLVPLLNGERIEAPSSPKISDYKGAVVLLNFWASWCEPCIQEFPDMISLSEKRPEVRIVAINRDQKKEDAIRFIESFPEAKGKIDFYWDPDGSITALYGTEVLPESYLIGYDFKVLRKIIGIEKWDHPNVLRFIDSLEK